MDIKTNEPPPGMGTQPKNRDVPENWAGKAAGRIAVVFLEVLSR